ncbi:hypothetical protein [Brevundimonas sp. SL130]|uniref:hypothetical protein n=1 Tax=Brevundimonas sp. SL130 TaxID=2995143 RepID=UPI00226D0A5D|nr:hypothetical protein [Brevundimonas sp. SL130]WAC58694.1 hypothetical protein OU998_10720 [Brevundimonas sp. SL130]
MAFLDWLNPFAPCGMSTGVAGREAKVVAAHICPVTYLYWDIELEPSGFPMFPKCLF